MEYTKDKFSVATGSSCFGCKQRNVWIEELQKKIEELEKALSEKETE